ncbi:MAG: hypothetical protein LUD69_00640 [Oscillospiraceae bacterium]|nr:hypothetical protein [Oscillospiraceae bacterium]
MSDAEKKTTPEQRRANAARVAKCRARRAAVERLKTDAGFPALWDTLALFSGYPFRTAKGLRFRYELKGGEMKVNRKEKTITRSTVEMAYEKARRGPVTGPKKLGVFGASYLYPVFLRLGVINKDTEAEQ